MKNQKKPLALFIMALFAISSLTAQKKPIDHSVYDNWKAVGSSIMSQDGKFSLSVVNAQAGDGYLMQSNLLNGSSFVIDRGKTPAFTFNSRFAVCAISPFFEETRQARIQKKKPEEMPKDTLAIWTLGQSGLKKIPHLKSFKIAEEGSLAVAFKTEPPADTAGGAKPPRRETGEGSDLMLYYFATGRIDTLKHVAEYNFNKDGTQLFIVRRLNSKDSSDTQDGLFIYNLLTQTKQALLTGPRKSRFFLPVSDKDEQFFAFFANTDTTKDAEKLVNIYFFKKGDTQATLMVDANIKGLPKDWIISQHRTPSINREGTRLFFGIAPKPLERDTTLVDFETAKLDIWHYLDDYVQPMQLARLRQDQRASFLSYVHIQNPQNGLIQLATPDYPDVRVPNDWSSDWGFATGNRPYRIESMWNSDAPVDLYIISVNDGKAKKLLTAVSAANLNPSPQGRYLAWYDKDLRAWLSYEAATGTIRNLTESITVPLWDETNDRPNLPNSYGFGGWRESDAAFFVYDKYDIWEIDPSGRRSPFMLTDGVGRNQRYTFRVLHLDPTTGATLPRGADPEPIKPRETLFFTAFDHVNKYNGFFSRDQSRRQPQMQRLILDGHTYAQLQRSKDGRVFTFVRHNFIASPNMWMTRDQFRTQVQLSDINPQQKDYIWGTVELLSWKCTDGIPTQGMLFKPENFDPNKKYPMLVYFYERSSQTLFSYRPPAPSHSIINIIYFVSNGYLVFVPDIHYTIGYPGQSALNCIMPGVDMLVQYPWVDEENMGLQGQSWGGYQVAHMITRTNRFKAAGAGTPVCNMISAYGGIRWGTGMVRQFQYEKTQSRLGKNLWDGLDLYIENSPLFFVPNINTPLLIMHNDNDGAVPWYQGIELFTAMRRLGKPVWLLNYNGDAHNLQERRNRKDLSIRLEQFFDHFLRGAPAPVWIREGVPAIRKGIDWGFGFE